MDTGEHIEGPLGLKTAQADAVQVFHQIPAAAVVLIPHVLNVPIAVAHGLDGGILAGGGGGHDAELMEFGHGGNDGLGGAHIAHAPAGHGMALGEAVDQHGAVVQLRQIRRGDVALPIGEFRVDLIGEDHDVGAL